MTLTSFVLEDDLAALRTDVQLEVAALGRHAREAHDPRWRVPPDDVEDERWHPGALYDHVGLGHLCPCGGHRPRHAMCSAGRLVRVKRSGPAIGPQRFAGRPDRDGGVGHVLGEELAGVR